MTSVYFVGTYKPIMCGIADYTAFITREIPPDKWGALSFNLKNFEGRINQQNGESQKRIWYGIPSFERYSYTDLLKGLKQLGANNRDSVLWFQHENGIWRDDENFVKMLSNLMIPKVVTFHTLHFQSGETPSGLRTNQYDLLQAVFPHIDAITVFSHGVFRAVTTAFPQYRQKVYVIKHGVPTNTLVSHMSRTEAKQNLKDFLLNKSNLDPKTKKALEQQNILTDNNIFIIGETGFLCPGKQSELLFRVRDTISQYLPNKKIVALRIGATRDEVQGEYARKLKQKQNQRDKFLIDTHLPEDMLRLAQKAFDINFYWPECCTQSGIIAHALGAGALIAGRNMEGSGETLQEAGAITSTRMESLISGIVNLMLYPERSDLMEKQALQYAAEYSWENQAKRHSELAAKILNIPAKVTVYSGVEKILSRVPGKDESERLQLQNSLGSGTLAK